MKWNSAHAVSAGVTLSLAAALAGQAYASCDSGQRVSHQAAECLRVKWSNNRWPSLSSVEMQNLCSDYGTVVAKVEREDGSGDIWSLSDGRTRKTSNLFPTESVYCCEDLSELCNKSDIVNDASCLDQFLASPASQFCSQSQARRSGDDDCAILTECKPPERSEGGSYQGGILTSTTVSWSDTAKLHSCGAGLIVGECPPPQDRLEEPDYWDVGGT